MLEAYTQSLADIEPYCSKRLLLLCNEAARHWKQECKAWPLIDGREIAEHVSILLNLGKKFVPKERQDLTCTLP